MFSGRRFRNNIYQRKGVPEFEFGNAQIVVDEGRLMLIMP